MITRNFKINLNPGTAVPPTIHANQYDAGETWVFSIYTSAGQKYVPESGAIIGIKTDGKGIVNTATVNTEGDVVVTETQQMTACAGKNVFELSIDGQTHGTANFIVMVEKKPTDDAVMSESDLSLIQSAVDSAQEIIDIVDGTLNFVTPEMYGAEGDGITDDTEAIQDAVDTGEVVHFNNNKTYLTTGNIVVSNSDKTVIHGNGAKLLVESSPSTKSCFAFTDSNNIEIHDLSFESTRDQTESPPTGHTRISSNGSNILGISFTNCSNVVIKNVAFNNMASDLWFRVKSSETTINDNILIDGWYSRNASMPAYLSKVTNIKIKNADLLPAVNMGSGDHLLYFSQASDNIYISDCMFDVADENFGYAITAHTSGNVPQDDYDYQPKNIYIDNSFMKFCGALWSSISMYHVTNCRFKQAYGTSGKVLFGGLGLLEARDSTIDMLFSSLTTLSADAIGVDFKRCEIRCPNDSSINIFSNMCPTKMIDCHVYNAALFYASNSADELYAIFKNNLVELDNKLTCFVSRRGNTKGVIKLYNNIFIGKASDKTNWVIFNSTTSDMTGISCYGNIANNVTGFARGSTTDNGVFINNYLNDTLVEIN